MVMSGRGRPIGTLSSSGSSNERNVRVHRRWEMYQTQGTQELMAPAQPFSKRHGFRGDPKEITVREDAPEPLRYFVVQTAIELGAFTQLPAPALMPGAADDARPVQLERIPEYLG